MHAMKQRVSLIDTVLFLNANNKHGDNRMNDTAID